MTDETRDETQQPTDDQETTGETPPAPAGPADPPPPEAETDDEEDANPPGERRMPFLEHLEELRWHLIKSIAAIVVFAVCAWFFRLDVIALLVRLMPQPDAKLTVLAPMDALMAQLKISLTLGFVMGLPVVIYQAWAFIAPGLLDKERRFVPYLVFFTILCFVVGASFAYFLIIPFALEFLAYFGGDQLVPMWTIDKFLSFVVQLILGFGMVFEMPMLALVLTRIGIIDHHFLRKYRAYGIVGIFFVAALLTPPEPSTQIMLALPLIGLYEMSVLVAKFTKRRMDAREAAEEAEDD